MLSKNIFSLIKQTRTFHLSSLNNVKVAVLGANGAIGQPLSLLLKDSISVTELALYDIKSVAGVAADLSHISKRAKITGTSSSPEGLSECIKDSKIVVIVAGRSRNLDMTRFDLFTTNASIVSSLAHQCAIVNPQCMLCIVTNPIDSLVPMVAQIFKSLSVYDPCRLFGVTSLNSVRASTFVAQAKGLIGTKLYVPVIGGNSENTLIPLISQCIPPLSFPPKQRIELTRRIQSAGTEINEAKAGKGSATLSTAYSTFKFITSLIDGMDGKKGVVQCAYVESTRGPCEFFATPIVLGMNGIHKIIGAGRLIDYELSLIEAAIPELQESIKTGKEFAAQYISSIKAV